MTASERILAGLKALIAPLAEMSSLVWTINLALTCGVVFLALVAGRLTRRLARSRAH